jgi:hypothetical protein
VAIRPEPTLRHYDPERIEYWITEGGRGVRRQLTRQTRLPLDIPFSWGRIRVVDRLKISNDFIAFGGRLTADLIGDSVVAVFDSQAPILRHGGHSQAWDHGAECASAFFGRLLLRVDVVPGFEARLSAATPVARYAAFVADAVRRYRPSPALREDHPELWAVLQAEDRRLHAEHPADCAAGGELLAAFAGAARPEKTRREDDIPDEHAGWRHSVVVGVRS